MLRRHPYLLLLPLCELVGCASPRAVNHGGLDAVVDRHIVDAARRIELAQTRLHGAVGGTGTGPQAVGGSVDQRTVSIAWKGDASQLIRRLAEDRGLLFTQMGVRMPLPVAIDVRDETLAQVLDRIRAQVGYRAVVDEKADALVLLYNRPVP